MYVRNAWRSFRFVLTPVLSGVSLFAQVAPTTTGASNPEVHQLDPFTVSGGDDEGYAAKSSASGLGFVVDIAKLPFTVNTLTPAFLQDIGVVKVEDALRYVSGIANEGRTSKQESYIIRGFVTDGNLRNGEKFSVPTDIAVIDRVEVIKGPAAIIYGVADPAGVVNTVTKKASMKAATSANLLWDEYGSARATLDANYPLLTKGDLRLAGRLILAYGSEKFPRHNEYRDRTILSPSFHLEYGKNTVVDLDLHRTEEEGRVNRIQIPWDRGNPPYDPSIFAIGVVGVDRNFTFVTPNDDWDFRSKGVDLKWVQHLTENLTFQFSYVQSEIDREHYFNLGNGRLAPSQNAAAQYVAGNFQMVVEPSNIDHRGISGKFLYDLDLGGMNHKITFGYRDNKDTNYEYAYYDKTLRTDTTLQVIADKTGGRAVKFQGAPRTVFSINDPNSLPLSGTTGATNPNPVAVRSAYLTDYITALDGRLNVLLGVSYIEVVTQDTSATVPQLGAIYDLGNGVGVYALYSESAKANGRASTLNPALGFLDLETGEGTELGLKFNSPAGKLAGNIAYFDIKRKNIVQFLGGGIFDQNNNLPSGEEVSSGIEMDVTYNPTPEWSMMLAYAYTDAYISEQEKAVTPDYNGDGISDAVGLGKEGVAKNDIRVWSSYKFKADSNLAGFSIGGGVTWREGAIQQFAGYIQRFIRENGNPTRLDLFAAYRTKLFGTDTKFQANWYNATDANYLDRRGYIVQPSTVTLTVDTRW